MKPTKILATKISHYLLLLIIFLQPQGSTSLVLAPSIHRDVSLSIIDLWYHQFTDDSTSPGANANKTLYSSTINRISKVSQPLFMTCMCPYVVYQVTLSFFLSSLDFYEFLKCRKIMNVIAFGQRPNFVKMTRREFFIL